MYRRHILTPAMPLGKLPTGRQVIAYIEGVNALIMLGGGVIATAATAMLVGNYQALGVAGGIGAVLVLSLVMWLATRHNALSRLESVAVQFFAYIIKFVFLFLVLFLAHAYAWCDVRFMAGAIGIGIIIHLVLATYVVARTPVALDVDGDH